MLKITIFFPCWFWGHIFCGVYISGEVFSSPLQTRVNHPQIINREFVCKLQTKSRLRRNIADKLLCQNWVVDVFRLERLYLENEAKEKKNHTHIHRSSQTNPTASNALFESSQRKAARKHSRRGFMLQTHMFPWLRRCESFRLGRSARNKIKKTRTRRKLSDWKQFYWSRSAPHSRHALVPVMLDDCGNFASRGAKSQTHQRKYWHYLYVCNVFISLRHYSGCLLNTCGGVSALDFNLMVN